MLIALLALQLCGCDGASVMGEPAPRGYVYQEDGAYYLAVVDVCPAVKLASIQVAYAQEDTFVDELEPVWRATVVGEPASSVALFETAGNVQVDYSDASPDLSRNLVVSWIEAGDPGEELGGSVSGVLTDIGSDQVLWAEGIESESSFDKKLPTWKFGC
ncbi:MAG: hypothetical protein LBR20_02485 [Propionibacteriaceae bacterium]|nr:hypothetical protein [Propionibacteriaceae bacterium]